MQPLPLFAASALGSLWLLCFTLSNQLKLEYAMQLVSTDMKAAILCAGVLEGQAPAAFVHLLVTGTDQGILTGWGLGEITLAAKPPPPVELWKVSLTHPVIGFEQLAVNETDAAAKGDMLVGLAVATTRELCRCVIVQSLKPSARSGSRDRSEPVDELPVLSPASTEAGEALLGNPIMAIMKPPTPQSTLGGIGGIVTTRSEEMLFALDVDHSNSF